MAPKYTIALDDSDSLTPETWDENKCHPIEVDRHDRFWGNKSKTCIPMARSIASPGLKCELEFRQQARFVPKLALSDSEDTSSADESDHALDRWIKHLWIE